MKMLWTDINGKTFTVTPNKGATRRNTGRTCDAIALDMSSGFLRYPRHGPFYNVRIIRSVRKDGRTIQFYGPIILNGMYEKFQDGCSYFVPFNGLTGGKCWNTLTMSGFLDATQIHP